MLKRIIALGIIIGGTTVGWNILSSVVNQRTDEARTDMKNAVGGLWGNELRQYSPRIKIEWEVPKKAPMDDEERLEYKRKRQAEENTRARVYGEEPRKVVTSRNDMKKYLMELDDDKKLSFLQRRQQEEAALARKQNRDPATLTFSAQIQKSFQKYGLRQKLTKRTKGKQNVLVLSRENYFSPRNEPPAEFILLSQKDFVKKWKEQKSRYVEPQSSDIKAAFELDPRRKGLLWFSTYKVDFKGTYLIKNPATEPATVKLWFYLPAKDALYEELEVKTSDGQSVKYAMNDKYITGSFQLNPSTTEKAFIFSYSSRGMNEWVYAFPEETGIIKNFNLSISTDFDDIDFPCRSISPDEKKKTDKGWLLTWNKGSMVQVFRAGVVMPGKINPGPLAQAMSKHAPVSLLFFFFLIFILQTARGLKLHPVNYFFMACAFFSFNLLFAYLSDHLELVLSFVISAAVSLFLVASYLRLAIGTRFAVLEAGLAQSVYQVLFALAHFFEGYTGLTVTVIAIVTLAVVMRMTARIDWEELFKEKGWGESFRFRKKKKASMPPPVPPPHNNGAQV